MELIKSTTFTNSYSNEHLITIALYQSEIGYEIKNRIGIKSESVIKISRLDADEYYNNLIQETRKAYHSMEMPFNTTETK
jgi:hypothetical protein